MLEYTKRHVKILFYFFSFLLQKCVFLVMDIIGIILIKEEERPCKRATNSTWSRHSLKRFANNPTLRWCYAHMETRLSPIGMTIILNFDFWCDLCCFTSLKFNYLRIVLFWKMPRKMFAQSQ